MLNDEIDEVRIGSLHGIASFNQVMRLNEMEVDTVLFNLNEDNIRLRSEIYKFFGEVVIDQPKLFLALIDRIIRNLSVYPAQDQSMIFNLM